MDQKFAGGMPAGMSRRFEFRPGLEWAREIARRSQILTWRARTGPSTDVVAKTWWTMRQAIFATGAGDQELYRYGVHSKEFTVNAMVGPGKYGDGGSGAKPKSMFN